MLRSVLLAMSVGCVFLAGLLPPELVTERIGFRFTSLLVGCAAQRKVLPAGFASRLDPDGPSRNPWHRQDVVDIPLEALYAVGLLCLGTLKSGRRRNPELQPFREALRIVLAVPAVELALGGSGIWGGGGLALFLGIGSIVMGGRFIWFVADPSARPKMIHLLVERREARG